MMPDSLKSHFPRISGIDFIASAGIFVGIV